MLDQRSRRFQYGQLHLSLLLALTIQASAAIQSDPLQSAQPQSIPKSEPAIPPARSPAAASTPPCLSVAQAVQAINQEICVSAHVFDVVQLSDGTRFLDICPPGTPDEQCRFTILCPPADREEVGDLEHFRNQEIHLRGVVLSTHGRMGIVLSHIRQFNDGPPKFRPNPRLLHNFDGQSSGTPVRDPNLRASGHHRSFMNTRQTEMHPTGKS